MATVVTENPHECGTTVQTRHGNLKFDADGLCDVDDDEVARNIGDMAIKGWTVHGLADDESDDESDDELNEGEDGAEAPTGEDGKPSLPKKKGKKGKKNRG